MKHSTMIKRRSSALRPAFSRTRGSPAPDVHRLGRLFGHVGRTSHRKSGGMVEMSLHDLAGTVEGLILVDQAGEARRFGARSESVKMEHRYPY